MIESVKARIWSLLREKEVSLAMLLDRSGAILWQRGRTVRGRTVEDGEGFPKSSLRQALGGGGSLAEEDVVAMSEGDALPRSAQALYLRSVLVLPVGARFLLYLDSGSRSAFSAADREVFRVLGELLQEGLERIERAGCGPDGISGTSPAMARVRDLAVRYAIEEEPVLLLGETGVGKSHIAERIHRYSGRPGRLVVAHTPSIPESLFESEMFGHARGAFTGAGERTTGLVQEAEGGTLFLDEVSEVPQSFQAKLLMLAERRRYRVLGEARERAADVRILAACNRDLAAEVRDKRFRADLFYRLSVLPLEIPPLRERRDDIRDLIEQHRDLLRGKTPGPGFWEVVLAHDWPGNVRELTHVLKRAGIVLPGPAIGREVSTLLGPAGCSGEADGAGAGTAAVEAAIRAGGGFWDTAWRAFLARDVNRAELRDMLRRWYEEHGHSLRRLSAALNIEPADYPRFVASLHKYNVHPSR